MSKPAAPDIWMTLAELDGGTVEAQFRHAAVTSDPPGGFLLTCRPYEGLTMRQLPVRLTYHPTNPPKIGVRLVGEATLTRLMAEEFRQLVESGLMDREACSADDSTLHERLHIGRFTRD